MRIIDISHHNSAIDFKKAKADDVSGVIIRCGYGASGIDKMFHQHITKAILAGLPIGIYYFSYAYTAEMARAEGARCVRLIEQYRKHISMPVFFDWEYDSYDYAKSHGVTPTGKLVTAMHKAFMAEVAKAGYREGLYFNQDYMKQGLIDPADFPDAVTWYARYTKAQQKKYDLWQYTESGKVDGVPGTVDISQVNNEAAVFGKASASKPDAKPAEAETAEIAGVKLPVLSRGSSGRAVKVWQTICGAKPDGAFGPKTEAKTRDFQTTYKLKADGIVGAITWAAGLKTLGM